MAYACVTEILNTFIVNNGTMFCWIITSQSNCKVIIFVTTIISGLFNIIKMLYNIVASQNRTRNLMGSQFYWRWFSNFLVILTRLMKCTYLKCQIFEPILYPPTYERVDLWLRFYGTVSYLNLRFHLIKHGNVYIKTNAKLSNFASRERSVFIITVKTQS